MFERFPIPAMNRQIWKPYPHWDGSGDVNCWIKIWRPLVDIQPLRAHEIGAVPEYQVLVLLVREFKQKKSLPEKIRGDFVL